MGKKIKDITNIVTSLNHDDKIPISQGGNLATVTTPDALYKYIEEHTVGTFLAMWDSTTGLPIEWTKAIPYDYKIGDYYIVDKVSAINFRPTVSQYTGTASTTVETGVVQVGSMYYYNGTEWHLQSSAGTVTDVQVNGVSVVDDGVANINLSSYVKTVNKIEPDDTGDVTVKTFTQFPSGLPTSGPIDGFMTAFHNKDLPAGTAYLGGVHFSEGMPTTMQGGNSELIIYIPVSGVYLLEMSTTDSFEHYAEGKAGKWVSMWYGDSCVSSWRGLMTCPQDDNGYYIPVNNSDGVSKYYLDQQLGNKLTSVAAGDGIDVSIANNIATVGLSPNGITYDKVNSNSLMNEDDIKEIFK